MAKKPPDRFVQFAAGEYPYPSPNSTGDEDMYNRVMRKTLAQSLRRFVADEIEADRAARAKKKGGRK